MGMFDPKKRKIFAAVIAVVLVLAGVIGIRGTQLLMQKERETLLQYFSDGFLWSTARILEKCSVSADISEIFKGKVHARYDLGVGGVLSGMWKMAEASETGLRADLRAIPVRQETIEICERLDVNPYKLLSEGAVLLGTGAFASSDSGSRDRQSSCRQ